MAGHFTLAVCPSSWLRWLESWQSTSTLRRTRSCAVALALTFSRAPPMPCCVCPATASGGAPAPAPAPPTHLVHRRLPPLELPRPSLFLRLLLLSPLPLCPTHTTAAVAGVVEVVVTSPCTPCQGTPSWGVWEEAPRLSTAQWTGPRFISFTITSRKIPAAAVEAQEEGR